MSDTKLVRKRSMRFCKANNNNNNKSKQNKKPVSVPLSVPNSEVCENRDGNNTLFMASSHLEGEKIP